MKLLLHSLFQTSRFAILSLVIFGLFLLSTPILAQVPDAEVDFFVIPPEEDKPLTVGDHIILRLEVTHPANSQVSLPQIEEEWGALEVVGQTGPKTVTSGGVATTGKDIIVAVYEPGQYQTEALVVTHQKGDGSTEELGAPIIPFQIESVLVEGDTDLRDLKPQAILPVPPIWPLILVGFMAALFVAGALTGTGLWLYHRRKSRLVDIPVPVGPVIDPRPPEVIAYAELDRIKALNLPAKDQFKEHYSLVTNCLRQYIEGRYKIPALERTTSEIRSSFDKSHTPIETVRDFMKLFIESDFVKFARFRPHKQGADQLIIEARALVDVTTPVPAPEPVDELTTAEMGREVVV